MMKKLQSSLSIFTLALLLLASSCQQKVQKENSLHSFLAPTSSNMQVGGVKMIPIITPKGTYNVWTKTIGHNPSKRLLVLHGGPGVPHDYLEAFESFIPAEGIELIYYDMLGCGNSDNPKDTSLYSLERYVEEVEQMRTALGLDKDNFYLLGHSWGGIVAMEYALKYQSHLKGLIISDMMASCPKYGAYAQEVLSKQMPATVVDSIHHFESSGDIYNPRYWQLLDDFYCQHILRRPKAEWPEPVLRGFAKENAQLYTIMQGPSEFGIGGKLTHWDCSSRLHEINTRTLCIGAKYDSMDPKYMEWMSKQMKNGTYLYCPNGSHMCMYDDQQVYFKGLISFLQAEAK